MWRALARHAVRLRLDFLKEQRTAASGLSPWSPSWGRRVPSERCGPLRDDSGGKPQRQALTSRPPQSPVPLRSPTATAFFHQALCTAFERFSVPSRRFGIYVLGARRRDLLRPAHGDSSTGSPPAPPFGRRRSPPAHITRADARGVTLGAGGAQGAWKWPSPDKPRCSRAVHAEHSIHPKSTLLAGSVCQGTRHTGGEGYHGINSLAERSAPRQAHTESSA